MIKEDYIISWYKKILKSKLDLEVIINKSKYKNINCWEISKINDKEKKIYFFRDTLWIKNIDKITPKIKEIKVKINLYSWESNYIFIYHKKIIKQTNQNFIPYDILTASFWLVNDFQSNLADMIFGRPIENDLFVKNNLIRRPLVNEWIFIIKEFF